MTILLEAVSLSTGTDFVLQNIPDYIYIILCYVTFVCYYYYYYYYYYYI